MSESVMAKIIRPIFSRAHRRGDLLDLLDVLNPAPLIIVSGLVGAGKTSLVSNYVESRNIPCLWYQVDRSDENLSSFFHYLSVAVADAYPLIKKDLPLPTPECVAGISIHIKEYFRKLYRCMEKPFLMVFNDFQESEADWPLHRVIQEACDQLPAEGRVILISSNENPPAMVWLRANRSVVMIGWQELRLNPNLFDEITALNARALPAGEAAKRLRHRVGNWAAELALALQPLTSGEGN